MAVAVIIAGSVSCSKANDIGKGSKPDTLEKIPEGALAGVFTVSDNGTPTDPSDDKKIHFSKGNLWYGKVGEAAEATFQFEDKQYEFHAYNSANNTWGLFGWVGTSSTQFTSSPEIYGVTTSRDISHYGNNSGDALKSDWGKAIGDGDTWRTLSTAEWQYLFNYGNYTSEVRNGKYAYSVTVCDRTNCIVLLPDNWKWEGAVGTGWQAGGYPETSTVDNPVNWQTMENAGAVCLPAVGYRIGINALFCGTYADYWASNARDSRRASSVFFSSSAVAPGNYDNRDRGCSVRLVTESK